MHNPYIIQGFGYIYVQHTIITKTARQSQQMARCHSHTVHRAHSLPQLIQAGAIIVIVDVAKVLCTGACPYVAFYIQRKRSEKTLEVVSL